ncbi:transglycosylase family protein [Streptomyces sp. NPDC020898]|uniref:transglycosylase family protein n=1 Tax=Streptomyces sp. NPDC020898 TaxID=3365101 RepID=UPI003798D8F9
MLSGNGRHRRPRQAPALLVAAGVAGSAIAIPLLGATGASAASGTTWDRVAECESGGSWSADDGNGFYGGLQLTQMDWEEYGGLTYAPSADQASRSQQIAVAEKVLADKGAGVWEACALLSGLGKDTGSADVDTGVAGDGTSTSSGSGIGSSTGVDAGVSEGGTSSSASTPPLTPKSTPTSPTPSTSPSTDSAESADSESSTGSSPSPVPSVAATTDSVESSTPLSPSPSPSLPGTGDSQEGDSFLTDTAKSAEQGNSGQSAENGTGRHRGDTEGSYTVRAGDTLCDIADSLGLEGGWSELYLENEHALGTDPDLILPGQTLAVGSEPGQK